MPEIKDSDMYLDLRNGDVAAFNTKRDEGRVPDLENGHLRGVDFRGANLDGVSLKNAYMSYADFRGVDLRNCDLDGASLKEAHISGVFFPDNIDPQEIAMSVQFGTRLRITK
jgi:uncharacterized protein YjbI with pentapeptide repeats